MTKICSKCFCEKPLTAFYVYKSGPRESEIHTQCSVCEVEITRRYQKRYPDRVRVSKQKTRQRHKKTIAAAFLRYRLTNREEKLAKRRARYLANRDKEIARVRRYQQQNIDKVNARRRKRQFERSAKDPIFRLLKSLRNRMRFILKGKRKTASTLCLLGCDASAAVNHLEKLFVPGMTWKNHGKGIGYWQIDHIRPCCSFPDLTDPEQQKQCFHYMNLQPLWHEDHVKKGTKWPTG